MALNFPNLSRTYDATRRCICFWGHDASMEVSFHLEEEAIHRISRFADKDEASMLRVFDVNRDRIEAAATAAYARKRQNHYRLSASDV